jgi:(R,R)-butanediol dehydrogenase / meso-butanediol dehydrogenase / diacetyl reductase
VSDGVQPGAYAVSYRAGGGLDVLPAPAVPGAPGPGEVTVRVRYAGICGTDLHIAHGHFEGRVAPGTVLGHEASGTVAAVGAGVEAYAVGDPVVVHPVVACGTCPSCDRGRPQTCEALVVTGLDRPGCMQPTWTVPASCVLPLPRDLDLRRAALVEPLAVAVRDVRRGDVRAGDRVLVVGAGPVGVLIGLVCRAAGALVEVVDPDARRIAAAGAAGLAVAGDRPHDVDVAFEVSGSQGGLDTAMAAPRAGGTVVVVGIHAERRELDARRIYSHELSVLGARLHTRADFRAAIDLLARGAVDVDPLVSLVVRPTDVPDAVRRLDAGAGLMKVLVDFGGDDHLPPHRSTA